MSEPVRHFDVFRARRSVVNPDTDCVAVEEPLEISLEGEPFSITMRTPGSDADLAAGFLFTEGVIRSAGDVRRIEMPDVPNRINVRLSRERAEILPDLLDGRRHVATTSSCGLCGRPSLDSLVVAKAPLTPSWSIGRDLVVQLPARLRAVQQTFAETGGLHAAGLFDLNGRLEMSAEDVGRHNAVDKLIGRMLMLGRLPLDQFVLFVSGRVSFEIVQKAFLGGIPMVGAVSAPSSLAIELARKSGLTLLGFVRDERFNIYAHEQRVQLT